MKTVWEICRQTFKQWQQDDAFMRAAALAFYSAISLAPLVTIILAFASMFYGEDALRGELVTQVDRFVGKPGAEVIQSILANAHARGSGISATISVLLLFLGASAVFAQLQTALNAIWNVAPNPTLSWTHTFKVRLVSILLVLGIGVMLLTFTIGGAALSVLTNYFSRLAAPELELFWQSVNFMLGVAVFTLLFAALFKFLPDAIIRWRDVWIGAALTSILFNLGRLAIGFYLAKLAPGSAYGTAGSLIALLLWLNYSTLILFLGAEFTQVIARRFGHRIRPAEHAYRKSTVALPVDDEGNPIMREEVREEVKERTEPAPPSE